MSGGKPFLNSNGKSPGSVSENVQETKSNMAFAVSDSRKTIESRMSNLPRLIEKTAVEVSVAKVHATLEDLFQLFSSRKASPDEICLMMMALK